MKLIKLKIERILKYWNYLWFLRTNGILIFSQNLSLDAFKDLCLHISLKDKNYKWKILNKYIVKELMDKNFLIKMKNFRNVLILNGIENFKNDFKNIEKVFKKNEILILGFFMQNIFFFKQDFTLEKIEKKCILENLKKRINIFYILKKKFINNFKNYIIKLILILKKKKD